MGNAKWDMERVARAIRDTYGIYPVKIKDAPDVYFYGSLPLWVKVEVPAMARLHSAEQAAGDPPSKCVHYRGTYCARDSRIKRTDDVCAKCQHGITAEQLVGRGSWV